MIPHLDSFEEPLLCCERRQERESVSPLRDNLKDRKEQRRGSAAYSIRVRVHVKLTDTCRGGRAGGGSGGRKSGGGWAWER